MEQPPRRARREFSAEFKARTVELILSSGKSVNEVCRELDLTETAVRRWVKQARIDQGEAPGLSSDERAELARLRRENKVLREEREILKKAALGSTRHGNTSVLISEPGGRGGTGTTDLHARRATGTVGTMEGRGVGERHRPGARSSARDDPLHPARARRCRPG